MPLFMHTNVHKNSGQVAIIVSLMPSKWQLAKWQSVAVSHHSQVQPPGTWIISLLVAELSGRPDYLRIKLCPIVHFSEMYTVHCTLYTVQCTLYTVHCTMYTVLFDVFSTNETKLQFCVKRIASSRNSKQRNSCIFAKLCPLPSYSPRNLPFSIHHFTSFKPSCDLKPI